MIIVYHANNSLDANMIKSLLEQQGIPAYIQGEHLQSGVGELPAGDLVKVSVDNENAVNAKTIIEDWEDGEIISEDVANLDYQTIKPA